MSIAIGLLLPDTALLVADGRARQYGLTGDPIVTDDSVKITRVTDAIGVADFGVSAVSTYAVSLLALNIRADHTAQQIHELAERALEEAWREVSPKLL